MLQRLRLTAILVVLLLAGQLHGADARAGRTSPAPDVRTMERTMLERFFTHRVLDPSLVSQTFLGQGLVDQLQQQYDQLLTVLGPYRSITPQQAHQYYLHFAHGLARAYILLNTHGLIDTLSVSSPKLTTDRLLVNGTRMFITCTGHGAPTVLLDAGLGGESGAWYQILPAAAGSSRVCAYDRAGNGGSDARPGPRTSATIVRELHALLAVARIPGPYVLVGHSMAGFHLRVYAARYPKEVAGMVLVDCSYPGQEARFAAAVGPAEPGEDASITAFRNEQRDFSNPEGFDEQGSAPQVEASGLLGAMPLVVLTAGVHGFALPPAMATRVEATWRGMQDELAGLSTTSTHVLLPFSNHYIMGDNPDAVTAAIRAVVGAVRSHGTLPECVKVFGNLLGLCLPPA